jgi:nucleotide-binding universal stress UspA family protein
MTFNSAISEFNDAQRKASIKTILSRITGESTDLLSYDQVLRRFRIQGQIDRGRKDIPLDKIVGSVGRYSDFTADFLPRKNANAQRWARVKMASETLEGLPPIEVYKVGDAYFVRDGNHRVSIARTNNQSHIEAFVTEVFIRVPLTSDVDLDELIIKEEYAGFLEKTGIDKLIPGSVDFTVTAAGAYERLIEDINVYHYLLKLEKDGDVSYEQAVVAWYNNVYMPVIDIIRERHILRGFPNRTETDLYIWILEYRDELQETLGWKIDPDAIAETMVSKFSKNIKYTLKRFWYWFYNLITPENLDSGPRTGIWRESHSIRLNKNWDFFHNILVTMQTEDNTLAALDQALWIASRENAHISGLHLVDSEEEIDSPAVHQLRDSFQARLKAENIPGDLAVEVGSANRKIVERAIYTDLVVLKLAHAPGTQAFTKWRSGLRTLIRRSAQPLLVVPAQMRPLCRILLAFDGSPRAKEATYIATYMAKEWGATLYLLTTYRDKKVKDEMKEYVLEAKNYIIRHDLFPHAHMREGLTGETILSFAKEKEIDLILMGSYGADPISEMVWGSSIDYVLQSTTIPLLICR